MTKEQKINMNEMKQAVKLSVEQYGRPATIAALRTMYSLGQITVEQLVGILDELNGTEEHKK